jgi:predicted GNAT superfamily acetyltransferase
MSVVRTVISQATVTDAEDITALISDNSVDRGGRISGEFAGAQIRELLAGSMPVVIAKSEEQIVGVLFTADRRSAFSPSVSAMLKVWSGDENAYIYGPVCIAASERGKGLLRQLFDEVRRLLPGREAILFIQKSNDVSLRAHARLGMKEVAHFVHKGEEFSVFSGR